MSENTSTNSPVNSEEFRKKLVDINEQARMGGEEISNADIERLVELHEKEGLSLEECVDRLLES